MSIQQHLSWAKLHVPNFGDNILESNLFFFNIQENTHEGCIFQIITSIGYIKNALVCFPKLAFSKSTRRIEFLLRLRVKDNVNHVGKKLSPNK